VDEAKTFTTSLCKQGVWKYNANKKLVHKRYTSISETWLIRLASKLDNAAAF
jgi:hypothetical protein